MLDTASELQWPWTRSAIVTFREAKSRFIIQIAEKLLSPKLSRSPLQTRTAHAWGRKYTLSRGGKLTMDRRHRAPVAQCALPLSDQPRRRRRFARTRRSIFPPPAPCARPTPRPNRATRALNYTGGGHSGHTAVANFSGYSTLRRPQRAAKWVTHVNPEPNLGVRVWFFGEQNRFTDEALSFHYIQ